jgi:hypothetical protein
VDVTSLDNSHFLNFIFCIFIVLVLETEALLGNCPEKSVPEVVVASISSLGFH